MQYAVEDQKYHFRYAFDTKNGMYIRTGILDSKGKDTGIDPFMASYPHLIDIGIMGHCIHGNTGLCLKAGIGCYQNGLNVKEKNMSLEDFRWIAEQCKGRTNQFALGGRGDPDQHENFSDILKICEDNQIVPNFTTSGYGMTPGIAKLCKHYCGAVAVSWYRNSYTINAIKMLIDAKVKTNVHFVLGNNSINEAIKRLKTNDFPSGINAVIFLLHKPIGQGTKENVIQVSDPRIKDFFTELSKQHLFKVGLDSCSIPGAINFSNSIITETIDTCEGARYSCYISSDMIMVPCSFDKSKKHEVSLMDHSVSIEEAWNSIAFERFRTHLRDSCFGCLNRDLCRGGCPLIPEIILCNRDEKNKGGKDENKN